MQTLDERLNILPQIGRLECICLSPQSNGEILLATEGVLLADHGLEGDHHAKRRAGTKRQVTLIQHEHLAAVAGFLHREELSPTLLRRNLVVAGINLLALKGKQFQIADCVLEYTGPCDPCSRMEQNLGPGGLNAMRGHGGITARVITGGAIRIGDPVRSLTAAPAEAQG
ncbi:MAG: MOSC domain-containing protein [Planctomycetaceae bacterium]|nr:MOSC domain-containing protein [Planctomycetaceae bacterium]